MNNAKQAIEDAKAALTGAATNKEALTTATNEAKAAKTTDAKYYNETDATKKQAYDEAITQAETVLNNPNATQEAVNNAKQAIEDAKAALDGEVTDKTQLRNTNDVLNDLILEDPTKGKTKATIDEYKKVKEESEKLLKEVKKVIDNKNASNVEVKKALEIAIKIKDILENAKKSLLDAVEAREVVETIANEKIVSIKADKKLSAEGKEKAIDRVEILKKKALEDIDKSTKQTEIDKALRTFLYQIDQDALVFDLPTLDIKEALKSLVQGIVSIEQGKQISDQDVLSKLNLPEGLEVVKIEKPTTIILGATSAKVTIKLSNGSYATVEVPVEVVKKSIDNSKDSEDKVRVDKTTENTNREENSSSISKEDSKTSKNMLPNTGATETNTGLAGLGLAVLGSLFAVAKRRKKDEE